MISEMQHKMSKLQDVPNAALQAATSWREMKQILDQLLNATNSKQVLAGETIEKYGKRAHQLLRQYESYYGSKYGPAIEEKMNEDISAVFAKNIRSVRVRDAIRAEVNKGSLSALIHFAVQQETSLRSEITDPELVCSYCTNQGHRLKNCGKRDRDIDRSNAAAGYNMDRHCTKCDAKGHTANGCLVRAVVPGQRNNNSNNNNSKDGNNNNSNSKNSSSRNGNNSNRNGSGNGNANGNRNNGSGNNRNSSNNGSNGTSNNGSNQGSNNGNNGYRNSDNRNRNNNNYRNSAAATNTHNTSGAQRSNTQGEPAPPARQQGAPTQQTYAPPTHPPRAPQARGAYALAAEDQQNTSDNSQQDF